MNTLTMALTTTTASRTCRWDCIRRHDGECAGFIHVGHRLLTGKKQGTADLHPQQLIEQPPRLLLKLKGKACPAGPPRH